MLWQDIHEWDQGVTLMINNWNSGFTDAIMPVFSNIPIWIPMYVAVAACLFWRLGWKKALIVTLSLILTFVCCDQLANFIKDTVARLRPSHDEFMLASGLNLLEKAGGSFGFFSGHASNSFGFAVCSTMGFRCDKRIRYRGYAWWIFFWAAMVSISRIFVGKHYLGDVVVGIVIGSLIGFLAAILARAAISRFVDTGE